MEGGSSPWDPAAKPETWKKLLALRWPGFGYWGSEPVDEDLCLSLIPTFKGGIFYYHQGRPFFLSLLSICISVLCSLVMTTESSNKELLH